MLIGRLRAAGCVAAEEEAAELAEAAAGDPERLEDLVARRCAGEPLAWVTGWAALCGERVVVHPGVYVPRRQSELLVTEALSLLPERGIAADLCTGSGAIAVVLARRRPSARVVATEDDPVAIACARANGVEVFASDLAAGLPASLVGHVDVVTAVVPYVPTAALHLLPRDAADHEPRHALHGGAEGTDLLVRAAAEAASLLRPGGALVLELGGDQAALLTPTLDAHGYAGIRLLVDEEGDVRGVRARR